MTTRLLCAAFVCGSVCLAGSIAHADEAKVAAPPAGQAKVHRVGNDQLRFTLVERKALETYVAGGAGADESTRTPGQDHAGRPDGTHEDRAGKDRHHHRDHPGKEHDKGYEKEKRLPPGLRKKVARGGDLPPGWQQKLERGQVMPADIYAQARPLPVDVRKQLPADPAGTVTVQVDGEIVRVIENTREIIDILRRAR